MGPSELPSVTTARDYRSTQESLVKGAAVLSRKMWIASGVVVLLAVMAGVGVAAAAIPNSGTGIITACYQKQRGMLRVIDAQAGEHCRKSERQLSWSQKGPQGPAGPPGPQGPQGEPGISGREVVSASFTAEGQPPCPPNALCALQTTRKAALCPAGKNVLGGGYLLTQNQLVRHDVYGSRPINTGEFGYNATSPGWGVEIVNYETKNPNNFIGFKVYAICAVTQ